jgi:hypothetical protein
MAKVNQQTQFAPGCAEIVEKLGAMLIYQLRDGFDLDNNLFAADEIRVERLNQSASAILQCVRWFRSEWNSLKLKFDFQALVIDRLVETATLILVNSKTHPDDRVAFVLVNQLCFFFFSCRFVPAAP